jgi:hypothetical protein
MLVPLGLGWTNSPCGLQPPENVLQLVPPGAVAFVHTHPFNTGDDLSDLCNEQDAIYDNIPSDWDRDLILYLGRNGHNMTGIIIDKNGISKYSVHELLDVRFDRCGY